MEQTPSRAVFHCYMRDIKKDHAAKTLEYTFDAHEAPTNEIVYTLSAKRPVKGIFSTAYLHHPSHPNIVALSTAIQPVTMTDPTEDGWIGRQLTHGFHADDGQLVTVKETPDGGGWYPRRFSYRGKEFVWLPGTKGLFEVDIAKVAEDAAALVDGDQKRKGKSKKVKAEHQVKGMALANSNMPFWAGLLKGRQREIMFQQGLEMDGAFVKLVLASAMITNMICLYGP
ncbi:hypothetical protein BJY01DRAFT_229241 [Aspergillus pseudoustus]|uniref:Tubby C-terminal-like domain-containing protein n=1 Tax=Aspergillus pseudoustus TaxID=1810923 RepID=A0ABR4II69_9EURO